MKAVEGTHGTGLANLNLFAPMLLAASLAWLSVLGAAALWKVSAALDVVALTSAIAVALTLGILVLLGRLQPKLGRLPWLQIDRRMPVRLSVSELRDVNPYLSLLNRQVAGALSDAEQGVANIIQSLNRINEVAVKELARIETSKLNGSELLSVVQDKMKLDEQLGMILQMFVDRQEQEQHENLHRIERLKEVKGLEPLIDVIARVARQTNYLSINAAVEAARAGPSGRGFAVVAGEIRTLSTQTAAAVQDISTRIQAVTLGVDKELEAAQTKSANNQAVGNMKQVLTDIQGMQQRFKVAADKNSLDVAHVFDAIGSGHRALVEQMTEALGNMQFFDVMHQRVSQVGGAMDELSQHIDRLADQMCQSHWRPDGTPSLKQRIDAQTERYVMQSQMATHQAVVGSVIEPAPAGAAASPPKIELF